jgi:hypothetical protein
MSRAAGLIRVTAAAIRSTGLRGKCDAFDTGLASQSHREAKHAYDLRGSHGPYDRIAQPTRLLRLPDMLHVIRDAALLGPWRSNSIRKPGPGSTINTTTAKRP